MKWSIIGLIAVGFIAAFCAAVLVSYMLATSNGDHVEKEITFLEASRDISSGTVLAAEDIVTRTVPRQNLPQNSYREPAQIIGKVLVMGMYKGQAFTKSCFPAEGEGLQVAGRLAPGMRAVSLTVDESSGLRGILYPGCSVDILVSLKSATGKSSVSRVLLEGVQVLAVDEKTLFTPKDKAGGSERDDKKKMMVTVLVTVSQAQQLHLAIKYGTLSLALRNPKDVQPGFKDTTSLGTLLGKKERQLTTKTSGKTPTTQIFDDETSEDVEGTPEIPRWKVTIIQGAKTEDKEFDYPDK